MSGHHFDTSIIDKEAAAQVLGALAEARRELHRETLSIGGLCIELSGSTEADVSVDTSLMMFRSNGGHPDIKIRVERVSSLSSSRGSQLFDSGSVWRLYSNREHGFRFDFSSPVDADHPYKRLFVDPGFTKAILQLSDETDSSTVSPLEYPLDELLIMHRLTQEKAIELHSCGIVGPDGTANLFVGHSGAGKSTTARLWTTYGNIDVLSDDRIIVRERAAGLFMYGTPWHGEAAFASPASSPLSKIFILEHGHGNVLTRLSQGQAVAELFARAFVPFHRHQYVESALEFLQALVGAVPCYRYTFQPDRSAVDAILNFHD